MIGADPQLIAEQRRQEIERDLGLTVSKARGYGISAEEMRQLLELLLED